MAILEKRRTPFFLRPAVPRLFGGSGSLARCLAGSRAGCRARSRAGCLAGRGSPSFIRVPAKPIAHVGPIKPMTRLRMLHAYFSIFLSFFPCLAPRSLYPGGHPSHDHVYPCSLRCFPAGPYYSLAGPCCSLVGPCCSLVGPYYSPVGLCYSLVGPCYSPVGLCYSLVGPPLFTAAP